MGLDLVAGFGQSRAQRKCLTEPQIVHSSLVLGISFRVVQAEQGCVGVRQVSLAAQRVGDGFGNLRRV